MRKEKNSYTDRRTRYTRQTIEDALLTQMRQKPFSKITVTEICRISEINRGTFYLHYYDLDDVIDSIIENALQDTSAVYDHVMCPERTNCTYPFCRKIREDPKLQILFFDEITSARLLEKICELSKESFVTNLMQNSLLSYEQAEAVLYFQMSGCLAINKRMLKNHCSDWEKVQKTIDQFIRAGLQSYLIQDERRLS